MVEDRVTHMLLVPTMWEMVLAEQGPDRLPLPDLRSATVGRHAAASAERSKDSKTGCLSRVSVVTD